MNRRFSIFLILEGIILFFLLAALFRRGFILVLILALLVSYFAGRSRSALLKILALIIWLIAIWQIITSGAFWLAILFPAAIAYFYYRHLKNLGEKHDDSAWSFGQPSWSNQENQASKVNISSDSENEVLNLSDIHYHQGGNTLSIKKAQGNVKILVPRDVEVALNIKVKKGLVRVFNQAPEINDVSLRYFSENYESSEKRIAITVSTDQGNVEVSYL